jgi:ribonuclease HI
MSESLVITSESKERLIQLALDGLADEVKTEWTPCCLIESGSKEVTIYGDGSFSCELSIGGWAANIPSFGLRIAGGHSGPSAGYFEFWALLEGIRAVVTIDHTTRPLHLHTDCEYVIAILRRLSSRANLPARRAWNSVRAPYEDAIRLIGARHIRWSRADTKGVLHQICHQSARAARREQIQESLASNPVIALGFEERRRNELVRNRELLVRRMTRVENKLRACDARIAQHTRTL